MEHDRSPYDRPDPGELLDAVRDFLLDEPGDGPRDRLHRRVAANVVGIVQRQLAAIEHDAPAHDVRLARHGVADNRALAKLASSVDEHDPAYPTLVEDLADWARRKVAVVNPAYLEEQHR